jgi:4-amino-4-deoxy-L-arabinose transferase-like glycosyltransferase
VRPTLRWGLVVLGVAIFIFALDVWWFEVHRTNYPFDIDEAGYTAFGLVDYLGLHNGGLHGWWEAIQNQPTFAPLVPALTSLTVWLHQGLLNGFAVLAAFAFALGLLAYGIAERVVGPRLGAFAAIVTMTMPGAFRFAHEYIFALPTATFLLAALFAILRSEGLRSARWSIAAGVAIGLMLLSRTMAIGYVPGLLAAGIVPMALRTPPGERLRAGLNLVLMVLAAAAVAATWYAKNLQSVIDYLTGYGYGGESSYYGPEHSLISWGRFSKVVQGMVDEDLFLPLAVLVLLSLVGLAIVTVGVLRKREGRKERVLRIAAGDSMSVVLTFVLGFGALMTTRNAGDGFSIPISVLLPTIGVIVLKHRPALTVPAVVAVLGLGIFTTLSQQSVWTWASATVQVDLPGFRLPLPVIKGAPNPVVESRKQSPGPEWKFVAKDKGWPRADRRLIGIVEHLASAEKFSPVIDFATRGALLNTNTVQLAALTKYQRGLPLAQLLAEEGDTQKSYEEQLEAAGATVLVTASSELEDFPPAITQTRAEAAGRAVGFRRRRTIDLPNGRKLFIWTKSPTQ